MLFWPEYFFVITVWFHETHLFIEQCNYILRFWHSLICIIYFVLYTDYLQDQLSARNTEVTYLEERVRELETKEMELEQSALSMEKLEESFSSMALESQFEVESMKLDMMTLEQSLFEARKVQDETLEENNRMSRLIDKLQDALQDAQKTIISLNEENKVIKEKLDIANMNTRLFSQKVEDWLENKDKLQIKDQSSVSEQRSKGEDIRYIFQSFVICMTNYMQNMSS
jgi:chromosome segregation ATPase